MNAATIVVGVDGSEPATRALQWCAAYAGGMHAEVVVVHVVAAPVYLNNSDVPIPPLSPAQREELHDLVARDWCKPLAEAGVSYRVELTDGSPAFGLIQVARRENAAFVVVGRRGIGGFKELILGSTSHQLSHHLDRPLMIVP